MTTIEITVNDGGRRIFRGFFAPAFPHIKNLHDAFQEVGGEVVGLIGRLAVWEKIKDGYFQQIIVYKQKKYKLIGIEHRDTFFATAPMFLDTYEKVKDDAGGKK